MGVLQNSIHLLKIQVPIQGEIYQRLKLIVYTDKQTHYLLLYLIIYWRQLQERLKLIKQT